MIDRKELNIEKIKGNRIVLGQPLATDLCCDDCKCAVHHTVPMIIDGELKYYCVRCEGKHAPKHQIGN